MYAYKGGEIKCDTKTKRFQMKKRECSRPVSGTCSLECISHRSSPIDLRNKDVLNVIEKTNRNLTLTREIRKEAGVQGKNMGNKSDDEKDKKKNGFYKRLDSSKEYENCSSEDDITINESSPTESDRNISESGRKDTDFNFEDFLAETHYNVNSKLGEEYSVLDENVYLRNTNNQVNYDVIKNDLELINQDIKNVSKIFNFAINTKVIRQNKSTQTEPIVVLNGELTEVLKKINGNFWGEAEDFINNNNMKMNSHSNSGGSMNSIPSYILKKKSNKAVFSTIANFSLSRVLILLIIFVLGYLIWDTRDFIREGVQKIVGIISEFVLFRTKKAEETVLEKAFRIANNMLQVIQSIWQLFFKI